MKTAIEPLSHGSRSSAAAVGNGSRATRIVPTDGELLMRFRRHRDQQALAQLVERHGALVWLVCQQVLRHQQDSEDAFQATFLIFAQRAGTIRANGSAAAWLFKVAQRTALAARRKRSRRRETELTAEPPVGEEALRVIHQREMLCVLLDELRTLPERYQTPLVLRYFEGQSRRAIAEQTDSTLAQVQGRLVRGRRLLRSRLVRRGVSLSLAAGAVSSVSATASAAVTPMLVADTATSCLTFTTSGTATGTSPAALELAQQGVKAMWYATIIRPAAILATVFIAAGIAWAAQQGGGEAKDGAAATSRVDLRAVVATVPDVEEQTAFTIAADAGEQDADGRRDEQKEILQVAIAELTEVLSRKWLERQRLATQLEVQELKKTMLQREIEYLQDRSLRLKWPAERDVGREERELAIIQDALREARARLQTHIEETGGVSGLSIELERLERETSALQRQLEVLNRVRIQLEFPEAAEAMPTQPALTPPAQTQPTGSAAVPTSESGPVLNAGDVIVIRVRGTFADEPIADAFVVEPMGTVALGPSYGRVKVAGLTILEAEEAMAEHLRHVLEDPVVQVTMPERGGPLGSTITTFDAATQFHPQAYPGGQTAPPRAVSAEQYQRALERWRQDVGRLQAENAELKKQLEQLRQ